MHADRPNVHYYLHENSISVIRVALSRCTLFYSLLLSVSSLLQGIAPYLIEFYCFFIGVLTLFKIQSLTELFTSNRIVDDFASHFPLLWY